MLRRRPYVSARSKRRHPFERGSPEQRAATAAFRIMLDKSFWSRHVPFAKTDKGRQRREERKFTRAMQHSYSNLLDSPELVV